MRLRLACTWPLFGWGVVWFPDARLLFILPVPFLGVKLHIPTVVHRAAARLHDGLMAKVPENVKCGHTPEEAERLSQAGAVLLEYARARGKELAFHMNVDDEGIDGITMGTLLGVLIQCGWADAEVKALVPVIEYYLSQAQETADAP